MTFCHNRTINVYYNIFVNNYIYTVCIYVGVEFKTRLKILCAAIRKEALFEEEMKKLSFL